MSDEELNDAPDDYLNFDWGLDTQQTTEQLEQLRVLVDECWEEELAIKAEEAKIEQRKQQLSKKQKVVKEVLEDAKLDSFAGTNCVYQLKAEAGIYGPESDEAWLEFKGYIRKNFPPAVYESFFKMHLGSLKSFVKKEFDKLEEKGLPLVIPGIPEPKPYTVIKAKAKKK